ncbi:hypothetical protein R3P38DRAFT_3523754 [Favolaschia claudopus]|uniref:Uncharacterized protein n=1 Tax=Favolaschia claudopus TaxID=2862362 RepID=A0AAW0E7U8_9AGAR
MVASLDAPRLRRFIYDGKLGHLPKLPWAQLKHGEFRSISSASPARALALCADNSGSFVFLFSSRHCSYDASAWNVSICSGVRHLRLELNTPDDPVEAGKLLDCLTLPSLHSITYVGLESLRFDASSCLGPPKWSSESFVALAGRSGFSTHLVCLSVHAQVADNELLRCLQGLSQLETLTVKDPSSFREATVTDVFLRGLSYAPDVSDPLIPNLRVLTLKALFNFGDAVYAEVVASRAWQKFDNGPFHANLFSRIQSKRMLSSAEAQGKLAELVSQGSLIFSNELEP